MNIAYITGTRAEFGLITPLLTAIDQSKLLSLSLYATGMHLVKQYGHTLGLVQEKFPNTQIMYALYSNHTQSGVIEYGAQLMQAIIKSFAMKRPDLLLLHGDRIEMLVAGVAALYLGIPSAHIHGGDITTTVDDSARHAITKLAHLHFPATRKAAQRIERMGEEPSKIHVVGALGLDALHTTKLPSRDDLYTFLGISPKSSFILVLLHPISEAVDDAGREMQITLNAVKRFNLPTVVIYPNGDPGSDAMIDVIREEISNPLFRIYPNVPFHRFAALQKEAGVLIGNSSAGIVESTYLKTPVVNVGPRQKGRERSPNIIDVDYDEKSITVAMKKCLEDTQYRDSFTQFESPWGDGKATQRIMEILEKKPWIQSK